MLHYILAQVSIHQFSNMWKRFFHRSGIFIPSALGSHCTYLVFSPFWFFRFLVGFNPAFPRGGVFHSCVPSMLSSISLHSQTFFTVVHVFHFPGASTRWQQPDFGETPRYSHTCGNSTFSIGFLRTGPRPPSSQLHFDSFRSSGLETAEKLKRQTSFAI